MSYYKTLEEFLENLPEDCKKLTIEQLEEEIRRAENMNALEALKIYENERELRG